MSRDDGFLVMDVAVDVFHDVKFRRLAVAHPEHLAAAGMVFIEVMGSSWRNGRRVTVEDGWPPFLPFDPAVVASMQEVGLLDSKGRVSSRAWSNWFGPTHKRREMNRERWRLAASARRQRESPRVLPDESAASYPILSYPSVPSVARGRARNGRQKAGETTTKGEDPLRAAQRRIGLPVDAP